MAEGAPTPMVYVIAEPCIDVKDRACVEECPVDCIYEGERMLYIQPDECIDCGACEPACPVEAIYHEDNVPEEWHEYIALNAEMAKTCPSIFEQKPPQSDCQSRT